MQQSGQAPPCPKCGNLRAEKVSERRADLNGGFFNKPEGGVKETIYVFRCACGTTLLIASSTPSSGGWRNARFAPALLLSLPVTGDAKAGLVNYYTSGYTPRWQNRRPQG